MAPSASATRTATHPAFPPSSHGRASAAIPASEEGSPAELGFQPQPQDLSISLDFLKQPGAAAAERGHGGKGWARRAEAPHHSAAQAHSTASPQDSSPSDSPHSRAQSARTRLSEPPPSSSLTRQTAILNYVPSGSPASSTDERFAAQPSSVLAAEHDPIHHPASRRSLSREPARALSSAGSHGLSPWSNGPPDLSPAFDSSSPSSDYSFGERAGRGSEPHSAAIPLGRSASASRAQQAPAAFSPWSVGSAGSWSRTGSGDMSGHFPQDDVPSRPSFAKRSMSVNVGSGYGYAASSLDSRTAGHLSIDTNAPPRGSLAASTSPRTGIAPSPGLATMHEEWSFDPASLEESARLDARGRDHGDLSGGLHRHRSASSAAALPFHASPGSAPRSVWADNASPRYAYASEAQTRGRARIPSAGSDLEEDRSGEKTAMQSPVSRGRDYRAPGGPAAFDISNMSPFGGNASADAFQEYYGGEGTESRRHSIATAAGPPAGQRRAVGFEVAPRQGIGSRTSSVGRQQLSQAPRAGGFGAFGGGGGGLAISEDDLAADLNTLQLNLDQVAESQQAQDAAAAGRAGRVSMRVPSSAAAATGMHAASMPPLFGQRAGGFEQYASPTQAGSPWDNRARGGGDMSASWDLHTPAASSPSHQRGFADPRLIAGARPIGAPSAPPHDYRARSASVASDASSRSESRYTLSPRAKAFNLGQVGTIGSDAGHPQSAQQPQPVFRQQQQQQQQQQHAAQGMQVGPGSYQRAGDHQRQASAASGLGFMRGPSSAAPLVPLSDAALAGLATLGPIPLSGGGPADGPASLQELGKGVPLHSLPRSQNLYLCAFKADRTDIYFRQPAPGKSAGEEEPLRKGDYVVVEGDRGKDIGTVVNCSITVEQVEHFLAHQNELLALAGKGELATGRPARSINPKRLYYKATSTELSLLPSKAEDEERALQLVQTKVLQRGLPMQIVAAEFQWDRRKLTCYYVSQSGRIDFRDLVKDLFRVYKARIWLLNINQ